MSSAQDDRLGLFRGLEEEPHIKANPNKFLGDARIYSVSELLGTEEIRVRLVRFEPGARTRPHRHSRDQLLCFLDDPGIVALAGGTDQRIEAGEYVLLPGGVVHMHGATFDAPTSHISMMVSIDSDFDSDIPDSWQHFRAG